MNNNEEIKIIAKLQHFYEFMSVTYAELSQEYIIHQNGEETPQIRILNEFLHVVEEFEETFEDNLYFG